MQDVQAKAVGGLCLDLLVELRRKSCKAILEREVYHHLSLRNTMRMLLEFTDKTDAPMIMSLDGDDVANARASSLPTS